MAGSCFGLRGEGETSIMFTKGSQRENVADLFSHFLFWNTRTHAYVRNGLWNVAQVDEVQLIVGLTICIK